MRARVQNLPCMLGFKDCPGSDADRRECFPQVRYEPRNVGHGHRDLKRTGTRFDQQLTCRARNTGVVVADNRHQPSRAKGFNHVYHLLTQCSGGCSESTLATSRAAQRCNITTDRSEYQAA